MLSSKEHVSDTVKFWTRDTHENSVEFKLNFRNGEFILAGVVIESDAYSLKLVCPRLGLLSSRPAYVNSYDDKIHEFTYQESNEILEYWARFYDKHRYA